MTTFFIGDTHFGHRNIINFEPRLRPFDSIEEHDEELIRRWNSVVGPKDVVWHLGDFAFGRASLAIAGRLNGLKKLVLGNHDRYPAEDYLRYFDKLYGVATVHGMILTHVPVAPQQFSRFRCNIHGHLHAHVIDDPRYLNVSAERIGLTPVSLEELHAAPA